MKRLDTSIMRKLLNKGIKKAKRFSKVKSPDYFIPMFTHETKNGWYYQIEKMYSGVVVYAFKPPRIYCAKTAEYYLNEEL